MQKSTHFLRKTCVSSKQHASSKGKSFFLGSAYLSIYSLFLFIFDNWPFIPAVHPFGVVLSLYFGVSHPFSQAQVVFILCCESDRHEGKCCWGARVRLWNGWDGHRSERALCVPPFAPGDPGWPPPLVSSRAFWEFCVCRFEAMNWPRPLPPFHHWHYPAQASVSVSFHFSICLAWPLWSQTLWYA